MKEKNRVRQIRDHFGLTQQQFAQRINKSSGYISLIETDRQAITEALINSICSVFPINEEWLRSGIGEMTEYAPGEIGKIGSRIKEIRKSRGLTQKQFASEIGYTELHIHLVEVGKINPSAKFLHEVAAVYNVHYEWILTGDGEMNSERPEIIDEKLISWLNDHPEIIRELRRRSGLY